VTLVILLCLQLAVVTACNSWRLPPSNSFVCQHSSVSQYGELARASNEFLTDLFVTLEGPSENIVISPFSIFTGLALLELGSAGSTRTNLESALHFPPGEPYTIHDEGHAIISSLDKMSKSSNESFILQTSNGVFLDDDFSISDEYRSKVECYYKSEVTSLPLRLNPEVSADKINSWIKEKTRDRIEKLVSPDMLGQNSQAVLVNSVYFKAPWNFGKFSGVERNKTFTRQSGEKLSIEMMSTQARLPRGRLGDMGSVIRLDYQTCRGCPEESADLALLLFLPDSQTAWASWQAQVLRSEVLSGKSLELKETSMRIALPKFEIKYEKNLTPTLNDLGLDLYGDFSGMSSSNLMVSDVVTKTFLRLDENGSEGAAATAVMMGRSLFIPRDRITVDRTFIVSVIHKKSGLVVFAGKIDDPQI